MRTINQPFRHGFRPIINRTELAQLQIYEQTAIHPPANNGSSVGEAQDSESIVPHCTKVQCRTIQKCNAAFYKYVVRYYTLPPSKNLYRQTGTGKQTNRYRWTDSSVKVIE